jgi:hypothetical protein
LLSLIRTTTQEEGVLVAWLHERSAQGRPVGHLLPALLASRGRVLEALAAYNAWLSGLGAGVGASAVVMSGAHTAGDQWRRSACASHMCQVV